jgi:hypothetical protein
MQHSYILAISLALTLFFAVRIPAAGGVEPTTSPSIGDMSKLRTFSAVGKGENVLDGYKEAELLNHQGTGCLTHMWFGGDWKRFRQTRIRIYIDGETAPSIDMELGMGHGIGFEDPAPPLASATKIGSTSSAGGGIYDTYRIPFGKSIRITGQRDKEAPPQSEFWWILRGTDGLGVSLGGQQLPQNARLKLIKLESYTAKPMEEFNLCDLHSAGALYQVTLAAKGTQKTGGWHDLSFMEGCMRAYFDGSSDATLLSSGLEDYFLGTYYFNSGRYANDLAGLTHLDRNKQEMCAYRFHDDDPVFFQKGLRLTCRCGETDHATPTGPIHGDPPPTNYTTYTWVYVW